MKLKCHSLLEAPMMNLIKLYDSLDVVGVCGVLTSSTQNVRGTTIGALELMAFCNDLIVNEKLVNSLEVLDVYLPAGPITYQMMADATNGVLLRNPELTSKAIIMATSHVEFKLVVGKTTPDDPLTEGKVSDFIISKGLDGLEFTAQPLPLMTKKVVTFSTEVNGEFTIIETNDVRDDVLESLMLHLGR